MRRVRRPGDPAPAPLRQLPEKKRRAPRAAPVVDDGSVSVSLLIRAEVVRGSVSEEEFAQWIQEAVRSYHRFRNGWVGMGATGGIQVPDVTVSSD